jgi:hypothetical protein
MKKTLRFLLFLIVVSSLNYAQIITRREIKLPDILGYKTLKCDFHLHTVFSDGDVWPSFRVDEAYVDGLDAIAITDHIEYTPRKNYIGGDFNTSYNIAKERSKTTGITVIHGAEITRSMPPGHLNGLFITDGNPLKTDNWKDEILEVKKQGGILMWNHPGWSAQQPDGIAKWYDEHTWIYETGILKCIEIVNTVEYYPEVHKWCYDKNLAMMGNTDAHQPTSFGYKAARGDQRTMTLVFATENSEEAIKEALIAGRTAVWASDTLYGRPEYLTALFEGAVKLKSNVVKASGRGIVYLELKNSSDMNLKLRLAEMNPDVDVPINFDIKAGEIVIFPVRGKTNSTDVSKDIAIEYKVLNMETAPGQPLIAKIVVNAQIKPKQ